MIAYDDLKKIEFFTELTDGELESIQPLCKEEHYRAGDLIFIEDTLADHLYVLKGGRISIDITVGSGKYVSVLTVSHFAEPFGWSTLVAPFRFTATARCIEDTTVFSIDGKGLMGLIERDFRMGFLIMRRIAKIISERVRDTRLQLIHTLHG